MSDKKELFNPFSVLSYLGEDCFCDRKKETEALLSAMQNGRNITLISPRRMGKTGLIRHVFAQIGKENGYCFYADLDQTSCFGDLVKQLGELVLNHSAFTARRNLREMLSALRSLRPVISIDQLTGAPQVRIDIQPENAEASLTEIMGWLERCNRPCYVALDEFQAICDYPEKKTEALLRSHIQHLTNVHFIFAGSQKHVMAAMFSSANRPFYQSTQNFPLGVIAEEPYYEFAAGHLGAHRQQLTAEVFHELYRLVSGHTWYMQCVLNRLYQSGIKTIDTAVLQQTVNNILEEYRDIFRTYCKLLTDRQLALLKGIAKEGIVREPGSQEFLQRHKLSAASTVRSALSVLLAKELVLEETDGYSVYDRFFGLWLAR